MKLGYLTACGDACGNSKVALHIKQGVASVPMSASRLNRIQERLSRLPIFFPIAASWVSSLQNVKTITR